MYPRHFVRLPTAATAYWDLVADRSPRDIKVLGPPIPVNLMAPARKAEVAPDLTRKKNVGPLSSTCTNLLGLTYAQSLNNHFASTSAHLRSHSLGP